MSQSEQIFQWLDDNRDFFKPEGICKTLKIDKGNFSKYRAAKSIPEKYIKPILDILFRFGFIYGKIPLKEFKPLTFGNEPGQYSAPKLSASKLKRLEAILSEKIPEHRNTPLGRRFWKDEQDKRVAAIQKEKDG